MPTTTGSGVVVDAAELAAALGVETSRVYQIAGSLSGWRVPGRGLRFDLTLAVERYAAQHAARNA